MIVSASAGLLISPDWKRFNNGKVRYRPTATNGRDSKAFAGGDVIRPHLLTTAIGHGSIAADGIHNFRTAMTEKRPRSTRSST